jgi:hypothetical protein
MQYGPLSRIAHMQRGPREGGGRGYTPSAIGRTHALPATGLLEVHRG